MWKGGHRTPARPYTRIHLLSMPRWFRGGKLQKGAGGYERSCHTVFSQLHGCAQDPEQTPERVLQSTVHCSKSGCCGGQHKARFPTGFTPRDASWSACCFDSWAPGQWRKLALNFPAGELLVFYLKTMLKMRQETSTEQGIGIQSKHSYQSPHLAFLITAVSPCADSHAENNSHLKQSKANFFLSPPWLCNTSYFPSKCNKTLWQDLSAHW